MTIAVDALHEGWYGYDVKYELGYCAMHPLKDSHPQRHNRSCLEQTAPI